jgi:ppGpp synthetase/RelA/SpoT-type nucleotidyltranferase
VSCAFCPITPSSVRQQQHCALRLLQPLNLENITECTALGNEADRDEMRDPVGRSSSPNTVACSVHETTSGLLPPWLERFQDATHDQLQKEIRSLEIALLEDHGFSMQDVADVVKAIYVCGGGVADGVGEMVRQQVVGKILGSVSFCKLLLRLEGPEPAAKQYPKPSARSFGVDLSSSGLHRRQHQSPFNNNLVSKDVLLASIMHFSECVTARYEGVYSQVQHAVYRGASCSGEDLISASGLATTSSIVQNDRKHDEAPFFFDVHEATGIEDVGAHEGIFSFLFVPISSALEGPGVSPRRRNTIVGTRRDDSSDMFTIDSLLLAQSASRLKRIEILTSLLCTGNRPLTIDDYEAIRKLLVSLTDDWRALAIRCVASLYKLEAILQGIPLGTGEYLHRSPEAILTAKESLRVYASLSHRLGLHQLQTQLEAHAFRVLYPRQYSAASALFLEHGMSMTAISMWLTNKLEKMLRDDLSLMYELEHVQVLSRVKEPYSFWKKLLRNRLESSSGNGERCGTKSSHRVLVKQPKELSIMDINDGVALRVILKARKLHRDESDDTTRARERMLCYYVQDLVRSHWPETDVSRVKDYIRYPKANGYQSLHHTSKITRNNQDFFFEVQIRSEEMHRLAEFGVAAHWAYKSGSKDPELAASCSHGTSIPSSDVTGEVIRPQLSSEPAKEGLIRCLSPRQAVKRAVSFKSDESLYVRALGEARQRLLQSQVYVCLAGPSSPLEKWRLLSLPVGSLMIDVVDLVRYTEDIPFKVEDLQVWRNGNLAQFEEHVRNGDMIVVQPSIHDEKTLAGCTQTEVVSSLLA